MNTRRLAATALVAVLLASGCVFGTQSTAEPPAPSVPAVTARPSPSPEITVEPTLANGAVAACSALLDNIPAVIVESGQASVAAAYEVTGEQLTKYFVKTLDADPDQSNGSDWWNHPTKRVDMCLYDGDLTTMTPGPPEADRSAPRVLVVISDGDAEFWASAREDRNVLPAIDPATLPD